MSLNFNKCILAGNLTRDPDLRYTPGGSPVCSFGLAVNRKYTQDGNKKEEVCFIDIVTWNKVAESCNEHLGKGSPVLVDGRLQLDSWENDDGQKRTKIKVVANSVQFLPQAGNKESQQQGQHEDYKGDDAIPF